MINFNKYIKGNKAFIPFVTAGDPNLNVTKTLLKKLIEAGSSIIEIGIPFSDPIAEGNTIMEADITSLVVSKLGSPAVTKGTKAFFPFI